MWHLRRSGNRKKILRISHDWWTTNFGVVIQWKKAVLSFCPSYAKPDRVDRKALMESCRNLMRRRISPTQRKWCHKCNFLNMNLSDFWSIWRRRKKTIKSKGYFHATVYVWFSENCLISFSIWALFLSILYFYYSGAHLLVIAKTSLQCLRCKKY